jgi:hypothetical protein
LARDQLERFLAHGAFGFLAHFVQFGEEEAFAPFVRAFQNIALKPTNTASHWLSSFGFVDEDCAVLDLAVAVQALLESPEYVPAVFVAEVSDKG